MTVLVEIPQERLEPVLLGLTKEERVNVMDVADVPPELIAVNSMEVEFLVTIDEEQLVQLELVELKVVSKGMSICTINELEWGMVRYKIRM